MRVSMSVMLATPTIAPMAAYRR
jgi:hypothetical protein